MKCISPPLHSGKAALKGPFEGGLALFLAAFFCFFSPSCRVLGRENNNSLAAPCCLLPNSCCLSITCLPRRATLPALDGPPVVLPRRPRCTNHDATTQYVVQGIGDNSRAEHQQPHAVFLLHVFETMCTKHCQSKIKSGKLWFVTVAGLSPTQLIHFIVPPTITAKK